MLVLILVCAAVDAIVEVAAHPMRGTKRYAAKLRLENYVHDAYPSWLAAHPGRVCPDRLADLSEYMIGNDTADVWGRPIKMFCGPNLLPGAKRFAVLSLGQDGIEGTDDDLESWE